MSPRFGPSTEMSRLTRDGTVEAVPRDQNLRRERGQGNIHFPCTVADHEQVWQPCPVDPYSAILSYDNTYVHTVHSSTYVHIYRHTKKNSLDPKIKPPSTHNSPQLTNDFTIGPQPYSMYLVKVMFHF